MTSRSFFTDISWNKYRISPAFISLLKRVVLGLAIFHFIAQFVIFLPVELARTDTDRDTIVYFEAATRLKHNLDVYQPWPEYGVQMTPSRFFYSPVFLLLARPLAELPFVDFARVWLILIFGAFWIYSFCLSRLAMGRWHWQSALVIGLVIDMFVEGHVALSLGQFEPFMWALFGLALTTRYRAGWLVLATLTKIHPLWALGLTLAQGGKKAWKSAALFAVPVIFLSWWMVGTHNWLMWWPSVQPVASQGTFHSSNWSLAFLGIRIFHWCGLLVASGSLPSWAKMYLSLCAVGAPLGMAFAARKCSQEMRLALVASAGVLFAPLCWTDYFPLFLLPLAVWMGERRKVSE
ncbi:DUF2029 domain-containing protein [bacterium]|nr:MAG: DUF2029 domain-containing protein [bacterium]